MVDLYKRVIDGVADLGFPLSIHFEATYGVSGAAFETFAEMLAYWSPDRSGVTSDRLYDQQTVDNSSSPSNDSADFAVRGTRCGRLWPCTRYVSQRRSISTCDRPFC